MLFSRASSALMSMLASLTFTKFVSPSAKNSKYGFVSFKGVRPIIAPAKAKHTTPKIMIV